MIEALQKKFLQSSPFEAFSERLGTLKNNEPLTLRGIHGSLMAFVLGAASATWNGQILVITPDRDRAEKLRDDCATVVSSRNVRLSIHAQHHPATQLNMAAPVAQLEALQSMLNDTSALVIASVEAAVSPLPLPAAVQHQTLTVTTSEPCRFEEFLKTLDEMGFERKDFVEGYGDLAVRGGIVDVFPFVGEHPLRIEFFGDTVESIREFNIQSQRSIRELRSSSVVGGVLSESAPGESDRVATLLDYLKPGGLVFLEEELLAEKELEELAREGIQGLLSMDDLRHRLNDFALISHSSLAGKGDIEFGAQPQPPMHGSVKILFQELEARGNEGHELFIACDTPDEEQRLRELLEAEAEREGRILAKEPTFSTEALHSGFLLREAQITLLTEHEIFGRLKRRGGHRKPRFKGFSQRDLLRLKRGDFVVHSDYGVGMFEGLQTIKLRGVDQEVMRIAYDENDTLYVNLNFINRVQKYASQEGHVPKLTKLGTPQWERLKARARKRIKDIARDLITLYARRKHEQGFAFSPDSAWQKELEASFMYEDTADQARTTVEVKRDMEASSPMDRLVCGDVGFGKTEVAVRAAFKAVLDGKQVAILVPTTILAQQHANTFRDRLSRYAVKIELLSRFRTKAEQHDVLHRVHEGGVDIVIGTHRLLSKDVVFKNLGLLVVDEEHRFGVTAKERLRKMRASVDTLTLTATPIPRTLQFSLMGARDLSLINTAPRNRLPIVTEIAEFDIKLIREAILRELHRGGQVYVIHDRIQTMDEVVALLERNIPEARIHVAHGQMKGHELEKTMISFLEGAYNVLVCTKIIESGIDIPTVNTIIINRADRFGLAELYQLRGRVGRSNVQAFAYLLTPPLSSLPRQSLQRLQAIQEFTELGSGFNLALRDMEIRGAGNLLGAEQSGFILEMGIELYQKIVEEAVRELKEQEFQDMIAQPAARVETQTQVETDIEALIPSVYIESDAERLDLYRRMYEAKTEDELDGLGLEMQDRFGEFPPEVGSLLATVVLKIRGAALGLERVEVVGRRLTLTFPQGEQTVFYETSGSEASPFQRIMAEVSAHREWKGALRQDGKSLKLVLQLTREDRADERLSEASEILRRFSGLLGSGSNRKENGYDHDPSTQSSSKEAL